MRTHSYLFLLLLLSIVGCESIDMNDLPVSQETDIPFDSNFERGFSFHVNPRAATYFAETHYPDKKIKSLDPILYQGDTVMYLVNFENNKGWMILSADKRVEPVLTAHDTGNFRQENSNEGLNSWFTTIAEDISYLKKNIKENTNPEAYKIWSVMDRAANTTPEMQAYFEKKYGIIPSDHYDIIEKDGKRVAQIKSRYASNYQDQYIFLVRRYIGTTVTEPVKITKKICILNGDKGIHGIRDSFPLSKIVTGYG